MYALTLALSLAAPLPAPQVQDLGSVEGLSATSWAVNADGSAASGELYLANGRRRAWTWGADQGFRMLDPVGVFQSASFTMSRDGRFAGGFVEYGAQTRGQAAIWNVNTGVRTDLFSLPGGQSANVRALSQDGTVAAGNSSVPSGNVVRPRTFRWTATTGMQDIIGTSFQGNVLFGGMSLDGTVIAGMLQPVGGPRETYLWTLAGGVQPLPPAFAAASYSFAQELSNDGRYVAGAMESSASPSGIFYYDSTTGTVDSGVSAGITTGVDGIYDMSGDGQTLLLGAPATHPLGTSFLWRPATNTIVPIDSTGRFYVHTISEDGSVVAGVDLDPMTNVSRAARWTAATGIQILEGLGGVDTYSRRVSADGRTILGTGELPNGDFRPVLWRADGTVGEPYCGPGVPNSTGQPGEMSLSGSNNVDLGRTVLQASSLPPGAAGFFLGSTSADFVFPVMSSQGALCLGGAIGRFVGPGQVQVASASGSFSLDVDPAQLPSPTGFVTASFGEAWYFQAWHRDQGAGGASTSNFTNGATVRFY